MKDCITYYLTDFPAKALIPAGSPAGSGLYNFYKL